MMCNKELFILRGCPGSGKSKIANSLWSSPEDIIVSADDYFIDKKSGEYEFDRNKIKNAHEYSRNSVENAMQIDAARIFVANTFTQEWEMKPYFDLAEKYDYTVYSIIVENRHGNSNIHDVPDETQIKMKERFEIKLI